MPALKCTLSSQSPLRPCPACIIPGPVSTGMGPNTRCSSSSQRCPEPVPRSAVLCQNLAMARGLAVTSPWGPSFASNATQAMPCRGPQRLSASRYLGLWLSGMSLRQPVWVSVGKGKTERGRRNRGRKGLGMEFSPQGTQPTISDILKTHSSPESPIQAR